MNVGCSSQFFPLLNLFYSYAIFMKRESLSQEYKDRRSLNDSLMILKKTWSKISCWQMGNVDKGGLHIVRFAVIIIYISSRYSSGSMSLKHKESDLFSFCEHESLE